MWRHAVRRIFTWVRWQYSSGCWWLLASIYQTSQRIIAEAGLNTHRPELKFHKTTGARRNLRNNWWGNQRVWPRGHVVGMGKRRNKYKILRKWSYRNTLLDGFRHHKIQCSHAHRWILWWTVGFHNTQGTQLTRKSLHNRPATIFTYCPRAILHVVVNNKTENTLSDFNYDCHFMAGTITFYTHHSMPVFRNTEAVRTSMCSGTMTWTHMVDWRYHYTHS